MPVSFKNMGLVLKPSVESQEGSRSPELVFDAVHVAIQDDRSRCIKAVITWQWKGLTIKKKQYYKIA